MKRLIIAAGAVVSAVAAAQIIAQAVRARRCVQDARWHEAIAEYKAARERNAPQVEIEQAKRELGLVFRRLRAEQA